MGIGIGCMTTGSKNVGLFWGWNLEFLLCTDMSLLFSCGALCCNDAFVAVEVRVVVDLEEGNLQP